MKARIDAVLVGELAPLGAKNRLSGIAKTPVSQARRVRFTGLEGDHQGDLKNHGGPEKALHHYPGEHYRYWRERLPQSLVLRNVGAFGENLSSRGLTEEDVCVGDIFEIGSARVQVSQPRQPCWKLNARFECSSMAREVQSTRFAGWYYRVLREGEVAPGQHMVRIDRPHSDWPLTRLMAIVFDKEQDLADLASMAGLELLAPSWRALARRRLGSGKIEDWGPRLGESVASKK